MRLAAPFSYRFVSFPSCYSRPPFTTEPFTEYRILVTAFTKKHDGKPSEVTQRTDVSGPSAPKVVNLTCHSHNALYYGWRIPQTFYNTIDLYIISYRNIAYHEFREIRITVNASIMETSVRSLEMVYGARKRMEWLKF